jgi:hypothetical protein
MRAGKNPGDLMRIGVGRVGRWCGEHPFTCAVIAIGTAAGAVSAVAFEIGPAEMATWKRALGGALAGAWLAMFPLGFRLFE